MHESARVIGEILMENVSLIEALKLKFEKLKLSITQICNRLYIVYKIILFLSRVKSKKKQKVSLQL